MATAKRNQQNKPAKLAAAKRTAAATAAQDQTLNRAPKLMVAPQEGAAHTQGIRFPKKNTQVLWTNEIGVMAAELSDLAKMEVALQQVGVKFARLPLLTHFMYVRKDGQGVIAIKTGKSVAVISEPAVATSSQSLLYRKVSLKKGVVTVPLSTVLGIKGIAASDTTTAPAA